VQISIDFETYSECDIKEAGGYNYAAHPTTEVLCMAWAIDDEEPSLWTPDQPFPTRLHDAIVAGAELWAWNAAFERAVWAHRVAPRADAIGIDPEQWNDTAALAATLALPRALGQCAEVLGLSEQKDKRGRFLIQRVCQPYRGERRQDPHLLEELYEYCKQDVVTEREIKRYVQRYKPMNATERRVWLLDQQINWRGLGIDTTNVVNAIALIYDTAERLNDQVKVISNGELTDVGSRQKVMAWSLSRGYKLAGYDKNAVIEALADPALPDDVRQVLEIRQTLGKASTSKYKSMQNLAGSDNRARGVFWYHGAQTGRWAGRGFQPQNLPRPAFGDTDNCISLFPLRDPELVEMLYGDPMVALSSCLRGMIIPDAGNRLIVSDFSAIEARVLAWLADEQGPLDVFRSGGDIYCHAATGIYGREITPKDKDERQIGKVAVLALGYGGGVGAFQTMAKAYRVFVEDEQADQIKVAWRKSHRNIVRFWYALEEAAMNAVRQIGQAFQAGPIAFKVIDDFLFARLPSGRRLAYFRPRIASDGKLEFWGTDSRLGGRWSKLSTYGGKLAENVTQAVARDLLAEAMLRLEDNGFPIVASIHDEIIAEVPKGVGSLAEFESLMCELPSWADGLPISAEGFECERYRK
jgi:DNA polymerase bacteriophage-type